MASPSLKLHSGYDMPLFGLGTWLSQPGEVAAAVRFALESGYRHIDCAQIYGNEAEIGEVFTSVFSSGTVKREELFVTSKLWVKDFSRVKDTCKISLKNLQLEYLDLYLIHLPFELDPSLQTGIPETKGDGVIGYEPNRMQEVWKQMEELVKDGLVRSIGVSNFTSHKIKELLSRSPSVRPSCNQVELHPYLPQHKLIEFCNKENVSVVAYSALGSPGRPDGEVREGDPPLLQCDVVKAIAEKHKISNAQVVIAWGLHQKHGVLVKSVKESRIKENLHSIDVKFDVDDMNALNGIKVRCRYLTQQWGLKIGEEIEDIWDGEYLE